MKQLVFNLGDKVWLHGAHNPPLKLKLFPWPRMVPEHSKGGLFEGTVVHIFERFSTEYVVEVDTHVEPILYVRDGFTLSDAPNKPIGLFRR